MASKVTMHVQREHQPYFLAKGKFPGGKNVEAKAEYQGQE